jgi:hypothetical protein
MAHMLLGLPAQFDGHAQVVYQEHKAVEDFGDSPTVVGGVDVGYPRRSQLTRQLLDPINLFGVDHSLLVRQAAQVAGDQFVMDAIGLHAWRRLSLKLSWNAVADSAGRSARDASPPGAETWGQGRLEIMVGFATPGRALPRTDHKRAEGRQQGRSPTGDPSTAAYPD